MASWFVVPDTVILRLSDDQTLTVRKRLNAGEQYERFQRMRDAGVHGGLTVDPLQVGFATVTAYVLDWSLTEYPIRGASITQITDALRHLHLDKFSEIREAIEAHEEAMMAGRSAEKNGQGGESASSAISRSPSTATGAMSGSTNSTPMSIAS